MFSFLCLSGLLNNGFTTGDTSAIILIKQKIYGKKADLVLICEKKGILIINICNRFLTKSDVFDDVNEENEHEENDINPIEDENNIFIKGVSGR